MSMGKLERQRFTVVRRLCGGVVDQFIERIGSPIWAPPTSQVPELAVPAATYLFCVRGSGKLQTVSRAMLSLRSSRWLRYYAEAFRSGGMQSHSREDISI